ncbi:unnamed protein product [Paramecium pentaurelia]|uniref:Uncharacterized protein n=1 Tax=Paramecium pentaurelia TaxID=43138 RepID=A0A8S1SCE6_9CILI|nr:unnamed protein product [Paramecium pentaurelia]
MTDLIKQLDGMFTREHLEKNKYLLKNLDPNLNLPIVALQKEYSLAKHSIEEILGALKQCKNCKLHEGYVTLLIPPHTKNIIINEISQTNADFKAYLIEKYLKNIECEIAFEGGCCRVTFKDDEVGLKFLDQAVNDPKDPLKAYVEPENVYQSLTKTLGFNNQAQYLYQYNNQMFQNLYIRKASDDVAGQNQSEKINKPYYPPVQQQQSNPRKQSGQERKGSEQVEHQDKKTKTPTTGPKEIYVEKQSLEKQEQNVKNIEKPPKVQQSPYVEKKSTSRKTSEQIQPAKHKGSKDIQGSPIRKASIQYKKDNLIEIFKQIQGTLKANPKLQKLSEQDRALLLRQNGELTLEAIHPTPCIRKESYASPQQHIKQSPAQIPQRKPQQ